MLLLNCPTPDPVPLLHSVVPVVSTGGPPGLLVQHRHKLLLVRLDLGHQVWVALAKAQEWKILILT